MKKRLAIILIAILVILSVWRLHQHYSVQPISSSSETNTFHAIAQTLSNQSPSIFSTNDRNPTPEEFAKMKPEIEKRRQALAEKELNEWRTPIEFYGRVVDESNNAVTEAQVDFASNDTSPSGTSYYHTKSDANGFFSIKDIKGKLLGVNVSKQGYYAYDPHGQFFNYAGENQNFVPDAGNPVVFRLRKKSEGEALIHYDKSFRLPKEGTPILIDLATGNTTSSSQNAFKVEGWTHDNEKKQGWKYDWKCRVSVPSGGLQFYSEEFPFLAPEADYILEDVIDMPVTNGVPWSYIVHRDYYVHTADGKFGRMVFTMVAGGDNFCELNCYFNPSGSRNLEPQ
jgi:hypothetical protein